MTLSILEGHSPIASLFKCDISYWWYVAWSATAELLVKVELTTVNLSNANYYVAASADFLCTR